MFRFGIFLLSILGASCALKVMTFRMFPVTGKGNYSYQIARFADEINTVNPDIADIHHSHFLGKHEEVYSILLEKLGKRWSGIKHCALYTSIFTRHEIVGLERTVSHGLNARIRLDTGYEVSFWSMDLEWQYFSLDHVRNGDSVEKLIHTEKTARVKEIVELIRNHDFVQQVKNSNNVPVIVSGLFNTPSHLDWTEDTKEIHRGLVVDWPVTKLLSKAVGMTDSFREVHPDPTTDHGYTWQVNYANGTLIFEDRIHYIFYRGSLRPTSSFTKYLSHDFSLYGNPIKNSAVVTEFEHTMYKNENTPSFFIDHFYSDSKTTFGGCNATSTKIVKLRTQRKATMMEFESKH